MAQHDYVIANGTGAAVRSDLNNALAAIVSQNSGASAPATTYAYQWWADTSTNLLKLRNGANSSFITVGDLTATNLGLAALASPTFTGTVTIPTATISTGAGIPLASAASPAIYFTGDTNTGIYSPGADQFAITTGGSGRVFVDSSGRVGLGTSSPGTKLDVVGGAIRTDDIFTLYKNATDALYIGVGTIITGGASTDVAFRSNQNGSILFSTNGSTERMRLDASGRLGIGTTSPSAPLHVNGTANSTAITLSVAGTVTGYIGPAGFIGGSDVNMGYRVESGNNHVFHIGSTERARIDSSGRLLIGTSSTSAASTIIAQANSSSSTGAGILYLQRGQAAASISSGETLGIIDFADNAGNIYAQVYGQTDAAGGSSDYPGRLVFSTTADGASSPTERMRIANNGKTSIAHANNDTTLAVQNTNASPDGSNVLIDASFIPATPNNTTTRFFVGRDNSAVRAEIRSNGGLANFSANNVNLSDRNAKKDIAPAAGTWDCLKEWEIVNFRYKDQPDDADLNMGVIAQQVAENCPEVITVFQEAKEATETEPAQEERLGVKDQQMMWMAIKALQEAQLRIETLEAEVAALKGA